MNLKNNIKRILQYRICLIRLRDLGIEKVFSYTLGDEAGVSSEQVRKDFSKYGFKGNKKGGYIINDLLFMIDSIFERDQIQNIVLIGYGNIGKALSQYKNFRSNNINIIAAFDIDPAKTNKKFIVPVFSIENLSVFIGQNNIKIAILAVPGPAAQNIADKLVQAGILGILNFSPVILKVPEHIFVNNVNLENELEGLIYITNFTPKLI